MRSRIARWTPSVLLGIGALLVSGLHGQRTMPLRAGLGSGVPFEIGGFRGRDVKLSEDERRVAGVTEYLMRLYARESSTGAARSISFSVYVGYYDRQAQGKTIHSPKNCLPGSGWEVLGSRTVQIETAYGTTSVNRYVLHRGKERALVLYWYQGRGRVEANEYRVKWDLLRDAALRRRSEEALVRIVIPVTEGDERAFDVAMEVARTLVPALHSALPT